jgi:hypothetical protein
VKLVEELEASSCTRVLKFFLRSSVCVVFFNFSPLKIIIACMRTNERNAFTIRQDFVLGNPHGEENPRKML